MTEVIATIRRIDKCYNFIERINFLYENNIRILRFNISKNNNIDKLKNDISMIRIKYPQMKIMLDIPYPGGKTRVILDQVYQVKDGDIFYIHKNRISDISEYPFICVNQISNDLYEGMEIIYDGGEGIFSIIKKVEEGGYLIKSKGDFIMVDGKSIWYGETIRNQFDFNSIKEINSDYIALSFINNATEVNYIRKQIDNKICLISKIETKEAIRNLKEITYFSDGIMIARGDLGLCIPIEELCSIEKLIAQEAARQNKQCFIATDILQSYINKFIPSRSDLSDLKFIKELNVNGIILSLQLSTCNRLAMAVNLINLVMQSDT